ncbi:hypothetical protein [Ferrovibrio sp.]|uniref:hypothetical protein n=1 Tax=Ferrovibrio sp. TaxID=1917215 RepID=UPI003D2E7547
MEKDQEKDTKTCYLRLMEMVKAFSISLAVVLVSYKFYEMPITLTLDFPNLLSLLLALFSVALSALFYFKATQTSNAFYDNTYKFTKDIAELLVKIDSGFGERLRHLDEGYSSMRNYLQGGNFRSIENVEGKPEKTENEIESEKKEMQKIIDERDQIVKGLVEKSQLQEEQKSEILSKLQSKQEQLERLEKEVFRLNRRLVEEREAERGKNFATIFTEESGFVRFTNEAVISKIDPDFVISAPASILKRRFDRIIDDLPKGYIDDLKHHGFFDSQLTNMGVSFIKEVARRFGNSRL